MTCKKCGERSCFCGLSTYGTGKAQGLTAYGDKQPEIRRVIERGPWSHYARCDECGVDAGLACRDEHDREALEVCDDRELVIDDHIARCKAPKGPTRRDAPPDRRPQAVSRRARGVLSAPQYAPCQCCGVRTRLWGAAVETGRSWCSAPECRRAKARARTERRLAAAREAIRRERAALPPLVCWWCGTSLEVTGRPQRPDYPCCGVRECVTEINKDRMRKSRAASQRPDPYPHA